MDKTSNSGGKTGSVTPSTALLNQKLGTSPAPRMLTPSELELLRKSQREIAIYAKEALSMPELRQSVIHTKLAL